MNGRVLWEFGCRKKKYFDKYCELKIELVKKLIVVGNGKSF